MLVVVAKGPLRTRAFLGSGDALEVRAVHVVVRNAQLPAGPLVLRVLAVDVADADPRGRRRRAGQSAHPGAREEAEQRALRVISAVRGKAAAESAEVRRQSPLRVVDRLVPHDAAGGRAHWRHRDDQHVLHLRAHAPFATEERRTRIKYSKNVITLKLNNSRALPCPVHCTGQ